MEWGQLLTVCNIGVNLEARTRKTYPVEQVVVQRGAVQDAPEELPFCDQKNRRHHHHHYHHDDAAFVDESGDVRRELCSCYFGPACSRSDEARSGARADRRCASPSQ